MKKIRTSSIKEINYYKRLSIAKLKDKVKQIKAQLPKEEQNVITFSKNFTLSLSNYCQNQCGYCFYNYKVPKFNDEGNVIILGNDQMVTLVQKALQYNCKEALIMSGERPDSFKEVKDELEKIYCRDFIEFVKDICTYLLDFNLLPHINIGVLTYDELKELKNFCVSMGLMIESTSKDLFEKGGVHEKSPNKIPAKRIEHINNAGKLKIPFTTGLLLGIGENFEDRIKDLFLIKKIHENYGHIQEVIMQNFVIKKQIPYQPKNPITIEEILKITAIAKIIFENEISVQVAPNLISGYEKDFIEIGIDDFGGVSPFTLDYINPEKKWPQIDNLKKICKDKGIKLKERLPIYEKFINNKEFCPERIKKRINNINLNVN
ncbi:MAG: 7,8-didemethyl-8-hydroxy-5-deazariboflavin synthase subunit CofG [Promethearchaeota archaeon]